MKTILISSLIAITLWADAHIFIYHRFGDDRYPATNTTIEELRREFEYFKENDYKVIPLNQLISALKNKENIPNNWVVLTIDDNYKSFYTNAFEIFKEYNYPFSIFVYVEATEKNYPDYLTWEQLKEIKEYGSIEFHSYAHNHMTEVSDEDLKKDFEKGLEILKKELNVVPKAFSYPYGEYNLRVQKIAKSYGFDAIINQNMGAVSDFSNLYDLDRTALVGKTDLKLYLRYKALKADWKEPVYFPKDGLLKSIHVTTDEEAQNGGVYITGHGWQQAKLKDGDFEFKVDKKLISKRSRIVISVGNKISTKLLIKDKHEAKRDLP
ncbi:MAG: polysaccharide deacetylase family protein [Sulfurospirillum sp.]|nr:polysaccharide deacetylase family protein [Sulfurospirillum sp.]MBL0703601.1 polysaccharide deacetylase family protein [Sulfurospirillum sp.]